MRVISLLLLLLMASGACGQNRFEFGRIQQATAAAPRQYVVPVTVSADGYSTFSANIYADARVMQGIKWQTVERDPGVHIVISVNRPLAAPGKITLAARYQGRKRRQDYWLEPVASTTRQKIPQAAGQTGQQEVLCPQLVIEPGSLHENVERLTVECGHIFGTWDIGDEKYLIDWVVEEGRLLQNHRGVSGLLSTLKNDYGVLGVIRQSGGYNTIDYHQYSSFVLE